MLGQSAASKIVYVRPVGGPENTVNKGEILTQIILCEPLDPHPNSLPELLTIAAEIITY